MSTTTSARHFAAVAAAMPMGNGMDENNVLGPLQNRQQFDIVARLVQATSRVESGPWGLAGGSSGSPQRWNSGAAGTHLFSKPCSVRN
jgi:acyl-CoA reductase-like NAD-dependent aldehyde dehydrogenase